MKFLLNYYENFTSPEDMKGNMDSYLVDISNSDTSLSSDLQGYYNVNTSLNIVGFHTRVISFLFKTGLATERDFSNNEWNPSDKTMNTLAGKLITL